MLLTNLKNQNSGSPPYNLKLNSSKNVKVIAKDNSGKATIYRTTITVFFSLEFKNEIYKQKKFESNTSYNNMENSFDLSQYQKTIEGNLINKIAQEITIFIST